MGIDYDAFYRAADLGGQAGIDQWTSSQAPQMTGQLSQDDIARFYAAADVGGQAGLDQWTQAIADRPNLTISGHVNDAYTGIDAGMGWSTPQFVPGDTTGVPAGYEGRFQTMLANGLPYEQALAAISREAEREAALVPQQAAAPDLGVNSNPVVAGSVSSPNLTAPTAVTPPAPTPVPSGQQGVIDQQQNVGLAQSNLMAPGGDPMQLGGDVYGYEAPNKLPGFAGVQNPLTPGNMPTYQGPQGAMPSSTVTGVRGQTGLTNQLMGAMQGEQMLPAVQAMQRNLERQQLEQRQRQAEQMALRGVSNSTINDKAVNDLAARQADEMTARMAGAQSQLMSNYTGNLGSLRGQNLQQQGQQFGQGMQQRGQQFAEAQQKYNAGMGAQNQQFGQQLAGRQQGAAEEAQRYQQMSGTRGQSLNEFFGFLDRQNQMDAQQYNQQLGAMNLALGAMGNVNTGGGQPINIPQRPSATSGIASALTQTAPLWWPK